MQKFGLILLVVILVAVAFIVSRFFVLGKQSAKGTALGLVNGQLAPCPKKPNCVNSEFSEDTAHYISPIPIGTMSQETVQSRIKTVIQSMGGTVTASDESYIASEFRSSLFSFVDDFELRLDMEKQSLQVRSASRVGYGDFGVNKKRVEAFRSAFSTKE